MSRQDLRGDAEIEAWKLLGSLENHPSIQDWLEELDQEAKAQKQAPRPAARRGGSWIQASAASLILALAAGAAAYLHFAPTYYETHVGEQRDILLADGSRITLNTNTLLSVRYSKARRYIELKRGEALFSVIHNSESPFDVSAGGTLTRAIGTEFNVDLRSATVTVSVLEGAVQVRQVKRTPSAAPADTGAVGDTGAGFATLAPALAKGEAIEIGTQDQHVIPEKADVHRIDAWRTRQLEFSDTPLPAAVEEFNRYSHTHVTLGSADLNSVHVSGVFQIGDLDGFLFSLKETLRVQALESPGEVTLVRKKP